MTTEIFLIAWRTGQVEETTDFRDWAMLSYAFDQVQGRPRRNPSHAH